MCPGVTLPFISCSLKDEQQGRDWVPRAFCGVFRLDREWIGFVHPMKISSHFWQAATTYWLTSPAKKRRAESKGCTENGNQAWGQIPKPVRMWLRPTHLCKAALQVLLPPIFNQSTSSSSQLRQQAPLLQPHHWSSKQLLFSTAQAQHCQQETHWLRYWSRAKEQQGTGDQLAAGGWHKFSNTAAQLAFFRAQGAFSQA